MPLASDEALALLRSSPTATLSGVLYKKYGMRNRAVKGVAPLDAGACRFAGPAYTMRYIEQREDLNAPTDLASPTSLLMRAIEDVPPGAVFVIDMKGHTEVGALGDVLVSSLVFKGVAGVLADGGMRDVKELRAMGMPIFCSGPAVPPGPVSIMPVGLQEPIACGGVPIFPGDYIVADEDGVVVVPQHLGLEVARQCLEKERMDSWSRRQVEADGRVRGRYPPDEAHLGMYQQWVKQQDG